MFREDRYGLNEKHIVYVINHVSFFVSHRLPLALAARRNGYTISLITGQPASESMERLADGVLQANGIEHFRTSFRSSGMNPLRELWAFYKIVKLMLMLRPTVVHCASPKGVVYGGFAAILTRVPNVILAVSGMGYAATKGENSIRRYVAGWSQSLMTKLVFRNKSARVIVQNMNDYEEIVAFGSVERERLIVVPGSGVDLESLQFRQMKDKQKVVLFPGRIIADKGIVEFVEAAILLRSEFPNWTFIAAGALDYKNPSAISARQVETWIDSGAVKMLGHVDDIEKLMENASIVCLPSYREGLPKALLEAAAAGCAIVTTDTVGCRDAIISGQSGILVPPRDARALSRAIRELILDPTLRDKFGRMGRLLVEQRFAMPIIQRAFLELYGATPDQAKLHHL